METTGRPTPAAPATKKKDPGSTQIDAPDLGATVVTDPQAAAPLHAALSGTVIDTSQMGISTSKEGNDLDATFVTEEGGSNEPRGDQAQAAGAKPSKPNPSHSAKPAQPAAAKDQGWEGRDFGDFKIIRKLGQGGMGEVFLAHQKSLDRDVALKTLAKHIAQNPNFVERFYREARTMAKLDHPNIVRGYAVAEADGIHHVAMELIDGKSMQYWLETQKRLNVGDTLHVAIKVADALQHAHDIKLIHRDIKPDNILVTSRGVVKVSDLGLAKNTEDDMSMTQSGTGLGTPYYMPPEQARNAKHVDNRSDIYALGSTLYHFLTGSYPFKADSALELIMLKEKGSYPPVRKLNPEVPERLSLIIEKSMMKDPKHRQQSCAEMIRELESLGLASETLSFIANATPAAALTKSRASSVVSAAAPAARPASMAPAAAAGTLGANPAAAAGSATIWYVKYPNAEGKVANAKLTTEQLLKVIKTEQMDLRAKACQNPKGTFLPLSAYTEFENAVRARLVKADADKRGHSMKQTYAKLDRADRWHKFFRKFKNLLGNVTGFLGLIFWLAFVAALIGGGYYGIKLYWPTIAPKIGMASPAPVPATNPGPSPTTPASTTP